MKGFVFCVLCFLNGKHEDNECGGEEDDSVQLKRMRKELKAKERLWVKDCKAR